MERVFYVRQRFYWPHPYYLTYRRARRVHWWQWWADVAVDIAYGVDA